MCDFVRDWMSLVIVNPNNLLLHGARDKEAYILQIQNLEERAVMELQAPWCDYVPHMIESWVEGGSSDNKRWRRMATSRSGEEKSVYIRGNRGVSIKQE